MTADQRRRAAAQLWSFRARAELEAAGRFARLARELAQVSAASEVVRMAEAAAGDELQHQVYCGELVTHFGAESPRQAVPEVPPVGPSGASLEQRVLYEIVAMACVTESLSAALLMELQRAATDPLVRDTIHAVLKDEIRHAQLGWAHLASAAAELRPTIARSLPAILAGTVHDEVFDVAGDRHGGMLEGLGGLGRSKAVSVFAATMHDVIFPGLRRFDVDTKLGEEWVAARL